MHPEAMRMRTRFGVAADSGVPSTPSWSPITAEMLIGAAGSSFSNWCVGEAGRIRYRRTPGYASQKVAKGAAALA